MQLLVKTEDDVERHLATVRSAADRTRDWLRAHEGDSINLLRSLKFEQIGCHPLAGHDLNAIEQINQTFTYMVALESARLLLRLHPEANGFHLAPGAHASIELDIMSVEEGLVGAETFAAVTPGNNGKLAKDLAKLAARPENHRYCFFASPRFPRAERIELLEKGGVQVWSVAV
jgi:hypothetical protein